MGINETTAQYMIADQLLNVLGSICTQTFTQACIQVKLKPVLKPALKVQA